MCVFSCSSLKYITWYECYSIDPLEGMVVDPESKFKIMGGSDPWWAEIFWIHNPARMDVKFLTIAHNIVDSIFNPPPPFFPLSVLLKAVCK